MPIYIYIAPEKKVPISKFILYRTWIIERILDFATTDGRNFDMITNT